METIMANHNQQKCRNVEPSLKGHTYNMTPETKS